MKGAYILILGVFSAVFWTVFNGTFIWLINSWKNNSLYTHGFIIILLCLALIIINGIKVKDVVLKLKDGLWLWTAALALLLTGYILRFNYITAVSFVIAACALNRSLLKKEELGYLNRPFWLMLLVLPLPFLYEISGYVSFISSKISALILGILFSSVTVNGIEIIIPPGISFTVGVNCSGANSVLALATVAVLWLVFVKNKTQVTAATVAVTVFAGFFTNILRIVCIFIVAKKGGMDLAIDFWHNFAGYFFYIVSLSVTSAAWILLKKATGDKWGLRNIILP